MSVYFNPSDVIVEFLRVRLTDPRARAEASRTETFTATAAQTTFVLTPTVGTASCITAVTVNSVAKVKWNDFYFDGRSQSLIFFTGLTVGDTVSITYKQGTGNWIYPDKPRTDIGATSFPRINMFRVASPGQRLGNYEAPVEGVIHFQVDIWCREDKDDNIFTIGGVAYTGEALADYLAYKITEAFETYESDSFPVLYGYSAIEMAPQMPFDVEYQSFHKVIEFEMRGTQLGRLK